MSLSAGEAAFRDAMKTIDHIRFHPGSPGSPKISLKSPESLADAWDRSHGSFLRAGTAANLRMAKGAAGDSSHSVYLYHGKPTPGGDRPRGHVGVVQHGDTTAFSSSALRADEQVIHNGDVYTTANAADLPEEAIAKLNRATLDTNTATIKGITDDFGHKVKPDSWYEVSMYPPPEQPGLGNQNTRLFTVTAEHARPIETFSGYTNNNTTLVHVPRTSEYPDIEPGVYQLPPGLRHEEIPTTYSDFVNAGALKLDPDDPETATYLASVFSRLPEVAKARLGGDRYYR